MKLLSVFTPKEEILEEGLKFGRKEIALVNKIAREVKLGFEWEYHVNKELLQINPDDYDDTAIDALADDLLHNDIARQKEEYIYNYIENQYDMYEIEDGTSRLDTIKMFHRSKEQSIDQLISIEDEFETVMNEYDGIDRLDDDEKQTINNYIALINDIRPVIAQMHIEITFLDQEAVEGYIHLISGGNTNITKELTDVKTNIKEFLSWTKDLTDNGITLNSLVNKGEYDKLVETFHRSGSGFYVEFYTTQQWLDQVQALYGSDVEWNNTIRTNYRIEGAEQFGEDITVNPESTLGYNPKTTDQFWNDAETQLSGDNNESIDANDYVQYITDHLQDPHNEWGIDSKDIQRVMIEAGIEDGVETISKPLKLHDALLMNERMFDHIQDVGWTDDATGLHINISLKGMNFTRDNFNTSKLMLLLQPRMLKEFFGLRGYVSDQFDGLTGKNIYDMAWLSATTNGNAVLIDFFEKSAFRHDKHQQVNVMNFHHEEFDLDLHRDRIEFRYVGGKDYEFRRKTIEWHIYRMVYVVMAAFSEGFAQKEYLKEMYKILNIYAEEHFEMSFNEIIKWIHSSEDSSYYELQKSVLRGGKNNINKKISRR